MLTSSATELLHPLELGGTCVLALERRLLRANMYAIRKSVEALVLFRIVRVENILDIEANLANGRITEFDFSGNERRRILLIGLRQGAQ